MSDQSTLTSGGDWLSLSQAAARLGVSEKTLRRRIHAGEIEGEKIAMDSGGLAWRVRLDATLDGGNAMDKSHQKGLSVPEPSGTRAGTVPELIHSQNARDQSAMDKRAGSVPEVVSEPKTDNSQSTLTAHLLEENRFLRAALEARDRDAAELRAALREALRLSAKALTEGAQSTLSSSSNDAAQSRSDEPQQAQSTLMATDTPPARNAEPISGPQIERKPMAARRTFRRWLLEILK